MENTLNSMFGTNVFHGLGGMVIVAVMAMLVVLFAMSVDLVSGIRKAKLRGEMRTSTALKRTLTKFISYQGLADTHEPVTASVRAECHLRCTCRDLLGGRFSARCGVYFCPRKV